MTRGHRFHLSQNFFQKNLEYFQNLNANKIEIYFYLYFCFVKKLTISKNKHCINKTCTQKFYKFAHNAIILAQLVKARNKYRLKRHDKEKTAVQKCYSTANQNL